MRIDYDADAPERISISLSRRNLKALLAKLDGAPVESACTTYKGNVFIRAEEDDFHYGSRAPGEMHPLRALFHPQAHLPEG